MEQRDEPVNQYPRGRGYGHDYMRGGEVLGGYGYSAREEYERRRGEALEGAPHDHHEHDGAPGAAGRGG